ncbi:MAG: protein kinase, partial [Gemmatimonadota bacterium]|nr:protein kinase [Gemmatimonadota bacterium]
MSRVFLATERALGRRVVVKVLPPELAAGVNRERFQREIQLAASLQHPHIVPLLAAGEDAELLYYTMPFIEGESLRDRLVRSGRLSVREVMRMLHDVVDALAYAHGRGVVHRDIKPGNILTQGSHALVTDFGVAKAISAALPGSGMTTTGMAIGTPAYMAPEQLAADPSADHRIDLYAVGLLAYELLSGKSPFASKSPTETMAAQLTRDPPPLETIRDDVPPALASLVRRLLAKNPDERPADAQQVLAAIEEMPAPSGPATPTRSVPARRGTSRLRLAAIGALAGVLLLVAAVAGAIFATRGDVAPASDSTTTAMHSGTDTLVLGDSAAAVVLSAPAATATQAEQPRLTRADSIAIAEAVRAELARTTRRPEPAGKPREPVQPAEPGEAHAFAGLERKFVDSVFRSSMAEVSRTVPQFYQFRVTPGVPRTAPPGVSAEDWKKVIAAESLAVTQVLVAPGGPNGKRKDRPRRVLIAASHEDDRGMAELSAAVTRTFRAMLRQNGAYQPVAPEAARALVSAA